MKQFIALLCILTQSVYCFAGTEARVDKDDEVGQAKTAVQNILNSGLLAAAKKANLLALTRTAENTYQPVGTDATLDSLSQASVLAFTGENSKDLETGGFLAVQYSVDQDTQTLSLTSGLYNEKSKKAEFNPSEKTAFSLTDPEVISKVTDQLNLIKTSFQAKQDLGMDFHGRSKLTAGGHSQKTSLKHDLAMDCAAAILTGMAGCLVLLGIIMFFNKMVSEYPTPFSRVLGSIVGFGGVIFIIAECVSG